MGDDDFIPDVAPAEVHEDFIPDEPKPGRAARAAALLKPNDAETLAALPPVGETLTKAANAVGTVASNALDTATFGYYRKARDLLQGLVSPSSVAQMQAGEAAFEQAHPLAAQAGSAAGYFSPVGGPALVTKAAGNLLAGVAGRAAPALGRVLASRPVAGALGGALVSGGTTAAEGFAAGAPAEQVLPAAGKAALAGGAIGGVLGTGAAAREALAEGAGGRAARRLVATLTKGAGGGAAVKRMNEAPHDVASVAHEFGIDEVAHDPHATMAATRAARTDVGQRLDAIYQAADQVVDGVYVPGVPGYAVQGAAPTAGARGGVPLSRVLRTMHGVEGSFSGPARQEIRAKIARQIEQVREEWRDTSDKAGSDTLIPSAKVRQLVTDLQEGAFAGAELHPKVATQAARRLATSLKHVLNEHVADASLVVPDAIETEMSQLDDLNRKYSVLRRIEDTAGKRAQAAPAHGHGAAPTAHEALAALHNPALGVGLYAARRAGGAHALLGALDSRLAAPPLPIGLGNRISIGLSGVRKLPSLKDE